MVKFCLLSTQRSGTTWLIDLLHGHPDIQAYAEAFNDYPARRKAVVDHLTPPIRLYEYRQQNQRQRPWLIFDFVDHVTEMSNGRSAVGFKLMYKNVAAHPEVLLKMAKERFRIIHLVRENGLDVVLSSQFMAERGRSHTASDMETERVSINAAKVAQQLHRHERAIWKARTILKLLPVQSMEVSYTDLQQNTVEVMRRLSRFLDVSPDYASDLQSRLKRVNPGYHWEKIENYDEVRSALEGTRYLSMLDRPEMPQPMPS